MTVVPMLSGASDQHSAAAVEVIEAYGQGRVNRRVLAGVAETEGVWVDGADGLRRRLLRFASGSRLVFDYWTRNAYGTARWRVCVCESAAPGQGVILPAIRPAVTVLADIQGTPRVRAFLAWLREEGHRIERFTHAEWGRIELHFQRMPLARLRTRDGAKNR